MPQLTSRLILAKAIAIARKQTGLTQSQLAKRLKKDRQYIWRIENARINITPDYLDVILYALNINHHIFYILITPTIIQTPKPDT